MEISVINFPHFVHKTCSAWPIPPPQTLRRSFRSREYDSGIISTTALFQQTCSSVRLEGQLRVPSALMTCSLCSPTFEFLDKTVSSCYVHVYSFAEIWVLSSVILFIVPDTLMPSKSNRWLQNPQTRLFSHPGIFKIWWKDSFHFWGRLEHINTMLLVPHCWYCDHEKTRSAEFLLCALKRTDSSLISVAVLKHWDKMQRTEEKV